jgi:hypothetical protein
MRGDQLPRQWRVIRAIKASPNGLTVAEVANFSPTLEALQAAGFPLYTEKVEKSNRRAFIDNLKLGIKSGICHGICSPLFCPRRESHL